MELLKLLALENADLDLISALVQDAVCKSGDLEYAVASRSFLVPLNRFVWEGRRSFFQRAWERRLAILHFDRVAAVRTSGIRREADEVLNLLAVRFVPVDAPAGTIEIVFAGEATIQLDVECIEVRLTDLGGAWQTRSRPTHRG